MKQSIRLLIRRSWVLIPLEARCFFRPLYILLYPTVLCLVSFFKYPDMYLNSSNIEPWGTFELCKLAKSYWNFIGMSQNRILRSISPWAFVTLVFLLRLLNYMMYRFAFVRKYLFRGICKPHFFLRFSVGNSPITNPIIKIRAVCKFPLPNWRAPSVALLTE